MKGGFYSWGSLNSKKYLEFFDKFAQLNDTDEDSWGDLLKSDKSFDFVLKYFKNSTGAATEEPQRRDRLEALQQYVAL